MAWHAFQRVAPEPDALESVAPAPSSTGGSAPRVFGLGKALIDAPLWYVVGQSFEQHAADDGSPTKLRGVFFHEPRPRSGSVEPPTRQHMRTGDFRQCLGLLLSGEDSAQAIARQLYPRFEGELERLPALLQLLEEKWGFPNRVFPLLWTQLRRSGADEHVGEDAWVEAFARWLQVLWARSSQTKVSRQCFVRTRSTRDLAKVYFMGALLGEGSYGEVHLALHTGLNVPRVVKSVPKAKLEMPAEHVEDEVAALKAMDHPHIVRIFEAFETDDALHIVMDYAEGGNLASLIRGADGGLPKAFVCLAAGQMLSALAYMHSKGVIHCDLKPQNVMLLRQCSPTTGTEGGGGEPHVLLVDFGLAELFEASPRARSVKGTPAYLAPEGFDGRLSHKSDAWAFGVVLFEMLAGQRPFRGTSNVFLLFCQIKRDEPPLAELPADAREFVGRLLTVDPKERLSAEQSLQHWWLQPFFGRDVAAPASPLPSSLGSSSYFYRAVMFCVASALGMKDVEGLFAAFQAVDTDKSGYLTKQQLSSGLARLGVCQEPTAVMASLDLDHDGRISLTEFLAGAIGLEREVNEPLLRQAFAVFDGDGDGLISRLDLQDVLVGDGPLADMLPDGLTIDQLMEEVSCGSGSISFDSFRNYLQRAAACFDAGVQLHRRSTPRPSSVMVEEMVQKLISLRSESCRASGDAVADAGTFEEFPSFDLWLEQLFHATRKGASLGRLLRFKDDDLEASYVGQNFQSTCRRIALLAAGLLLYSLWTLCTENSGWWPSWDPSLRRWEHDVHAAYNATWLALCAFAVLVLLRCASLGLRVQRVRGSKVLRFEHFLCGAGCALPWVFCFLANRTRVAGLFGREASDVFKSVNSDYDVIVSFLGTFMFVTTLTHVRFCSLLPVALSCVLAYTSSALLLGAELAMRCEGVENWAWPALLLLLVLGFNLWGHRTVEQHRRLTFLSLHASYTVLREAQHDGGPLPKSDYSTDAPPAEAETRYSRFKRGLGLVRRLADSMDAHEGPLRAALQSLLQLLETLREDVAHADSARVAELGSALQERGLQGPALELLLGLCDALPAASELQRHRSEADLLSRTAKGLKLLLDDADGPTCTWGWDLLSSTGALGAACEELLLPAVAAAAAASWRCGPAQARAAARKFAERVVTAHAGRPGADARSALTLRAAHWLAHRVGLWRRLEPWDRAGLLLAAAGLHSGTERGDGRWGRALLSAQPLLAHAAGLAATLDAIDTSGLAELAPPLRRRVARLWPRARPQCALEDAYRLRVQLEHDDTFPTGAAGLALSGLTLAAADLAFLTLPEDSHQPWALLCQEEARCWLAAEHEDARLDVAALLRGLIELLAVPLYETLARLGDAGPHLASPLRHLRGNLKHWKVSELMAAPSEEQPQPQPQLQEAHNLHKLPGTLPEAPETPRKQEVRSKMGEQAFTSPTPKDLPSRTLSSAAMLVLLSNNSNDSSADVQAEPLTPVNDTRHAEEELQKLRSAGVGEDHPGEVWCGPSLSATLQSLLDQGLEEQ